MKVLKYVGDVYDANCYVVLFEKSAVIIDPCIHPERIKDVLEGFRLDYIILTHGHADHYLYLEEFLARYNSTVFLKEEAIEKLKNANINASIDFANPIEIDIKKYNYNLINENLRIEIDDEKICFIYTPGHSSCSVCVLIGKYLFSGDTLFKDGIGRFDLYSSSYKELSDSLRKLNSLKEDYYLLPGHGDSSSLRIEISHYFKK